MSVPALRPLHLPRRVACLRTLGADHARSLTHAIADADVRQEIMDEDGAREARKARREHRGRAGKPHHCGGCYWVLQNPAQPCTRCGFTNGYGYPR